MKKEGRTITATYRLQLHSDFTLGDAYGLIPYLHELGISHVYSSPLTKARSGSMHCYDVVNPNVINPELGSEQDFQIFVDELHRHNMGLILDIVPNHMAVGSENPFWEDMLTHGRYSPYCHWFDVDWQAARKNQYRITLPVLGAPMKNILGNGEITLSYDGVKFRLNYYSMSLPVDPQTLPQVLDPALDGVEAEMRGDRAKDLADLREAIEALRRLPKHYVERGEIDRWTFSQQALEVISDLYGRSRLVHEHLDRALARLNDGTHTLRFFRFLESQPYRLVFWRRAMKELNYRRFFDINDLIGIRVEDERVFLETHGWLLNLAEQGVIDGIRIDHVDGLMNPAYYLGRAAKAFRERSPYDNFLVLVEKILSQDEKIPLSWPVDGTTGYDYITAAEPALTDADGFKRVEHFYSKFTRSWANFSETAIASKRKILISILTTDVKRVFFKLDDATCDMPHRDIKSATDGARAIVEFIAALPVYRTYISKEEPQGSAADRALIEQAVANAKNLGRASEGALDLVRRLLLGVPEHVDEQRRLEFVERLQQLSGPATAKGIEDTAFYRYYPLAHLAEVGGSPEADLSAASRRLHDSNDVRARNWPRSMLALTTHDTKRSADTRARIEVIAELPFAWEKCVRRWYQAVTPKLRRAERVVYPDRNTVYLLFQMLVAAWPPSMQTVEDGSELESYRMRIEVYMQKAVREAKLQTNWIEPNDEFERALKEVTNWLFAGGRTVLREMLAFVQTIDAASRVAALGARLLQLTSPGFPDLYQGDEIWEHMLVDPDNRRPVDYDKRRELLHRLAGTDLEEAPPKLFAALREPLKDDAKLSLIRLCNFARRRYAELFRGGAYRAVQPSGMRSENIFGYVRVLNGECALIAVAKKSYSLCADGTLPANGVWRGTYIELSDELQGRRWKSILTGMELSPSGDRFRVEDLFDPLPMSFLVSDRRA